MFLILIEMYITLTLFYISFQISDKIAISCQQNRILTLLTTIKFKHTANIRKIPLKEGQQIPDGHSNSYDEIKRQRHGIKRKKDQ